MSNEESNVEHINCPLCDASDYRKWAEENGFTAVKCSACGLIYVNPRPKLQQISEAVKTGVHRNVNDVKTFISKRSRFRAKRYKKIFSIIFSDIWARNEAISWLDVGAGYGEIVEAVTNLAPPGSKILGIEPMKPKVIEAKKHGINIKECYITDIAEKYDFVSLINVFSHIPEFHNLLRDLKKVLNQNGELFLETGNLGDLSYHRKFFSELSLPDHLVFASESNLEKYLNEAGFSIINISRKREDGMINFLKTILKKISGAKVNIRLPYTSPYRTLLIRARLL